MGRIKNLVIVESPAKARTLSKILSSDYKILASFGHVRDLPKSRLGFDPDNNFKPEYIISNDKKKVISELKKYIDKDTVIYLASDEDREGEAIAWHLIPTLGIQNHTIKRIVFHEITEEAILHAIDNPGELNMGMVDAQQARRILDRAVGYKLSPLLWKKIKYGLSAGRVQSAALRIVVDKEKEILSFNPEEYWKLKLDVLSNPQFRAEFTKHNGKITKIANSEEANNIKNECDKYDYLLGEVDEKDSFRNPPPPFTTSTLQQEASIRAGLSPKQTMMLAQKLYEGSIHVNGHTGGLITYMRTDSVSLSKFAIAGANKVINSEFGNEYMLSNPRQYSAKGKGKVAAQEAHEAIRPVNMSLKPSDLVKYLGPKEYKLYSLIWQRTVATQMKSAKVANTTYKIYGGAKREYEFVAKGTKIIFPGFMKAYTEGNENPNAMLDSKAKFLPNVKLNTVFKETKLITEQNFTKPPSRYSEASLIKKMETEGIGRPSTYAATLSTILTREYVNINEDKKLQPTVIGTVVTDYLIDNFPEIVDLAFTAHIESEFDKIANGEIKWQTVMDNFYSGFVKIVDNRQGGDRVQFGTTKELGIDDKTKLPIYAKEGTHGVYIQVGDANKEAEKKEDRKPYKISPVPKGVLLEDIDIEKAKYYLRVPGILGDKDGKPIKTGIGKFGAFLFYDNKYYSIKPSYELDVYEITLNQAKDIINNVDEEKAKSLVWQKDDSKYGIISIINGKYGLYIHSTGVVGGHSKGNFKLPKELKDDIETVRNLTYKKVVEIMNNQPTINKKSKWKKK